MAENADPSLTFGVEMEMLYVHELSDFYQLTGIPVGPLQRASSIERRMYVASILRHELPIGYRVPSILGGVTVDQHRNNITEVNDYRSDYTQWLVTNDLSIGASPDEICRLLHISTEEVSKRFEWDQIELVSPIFRFSDEQTWLPQLRQIHADLVSRPHLGTSHCNDSCGLHVHFALENSSQELPSSNSPAAPRAFTLRVLQHLIILWAWWEPSIESFHPFHRRTEYNNYAVSLQANIGMWYIDHNDWEEYAARVYSLKTSSALRRFLAGHSQAKYLKVHISPARKNKRETIEFREHRGTTDPEEIRWWVVFIERVIQYCFKLAGNDFRFFAAGNMLKDLSNPEEIWGAIEMPQEGRDYLRCKIHEYARLNPETFYALSSDTGMEVPGSQASITRNVHAVDLVSVNDADVESNYSTEYAAVDAVQPSVEDGGEIMDTVMEWDRYGRGEWDRYGFRAGSSGVPQ